MKAFAASCYSDNRLQNQMDSLLETDLHNVHEFKAKVQADHDRKEFILSRIKETGPTGYGKRSEMPDPSLQKVMHGIKIGPELMPPRSASMKKLLYHEVTDIMEGVIERATHDFVIPNLNNRLKEFNSERNVSKRKGGPVHPNKILETNLGGLLGAAATSPVGGGVKKTSNRSRISPKRRQDIDDDLGGTGSAFHTDDMKLVDTDGESDDDNEMGSISHRSPHGSGTGKRLGSPSSRGKLTSQGSFGGSSNTLSCSDNAHGKHKFNGKGMNRKDIKQKQQHRFFKDYKFPTGINENPMDFLNEDMELILAYADAKAKEKQAAAVKDELKGQVLRSKTRKKTHEY
jgi:hypothetical protein